MKLVMRSAETCSPEALDEVGIATLIATFYTRVRADEVLGPVFTRAIPEGHWAEHLGHMCAFWSSVMLSSGRYHGKPVQMHAKHLDVLTPAMFTCWLELWTEVTHELFPPAQAGVFVHKATQIASSLKFALFDSGAVR
jgi:hemoglobin